MMPSNVQPVHVTEGATVRKQRRTSAAHERARDAYRDVPILQSPTWNHEVAAYFYFGGISSGAFALGAIADVVGGKERSTLARTAHAVAFAALLPCPPLLIDDLGKPSRFHHMLRIFKPMSPMNLGAWTLTVHGGFSTILALRLLADAGKVPVLGGVIKALPTTPLSVGGLPTALTLGGYTGVLLGTSSIPVWYTSPLLGALFMASSLTTGAAATTLASLLTRRDTESDHQVMSPIHRAVATGELVVLGGYLATSGKAVKPLLTGTPGLLLGSAVALSVVSLALEVGSTHRPAHRRLFGGLAAGAALVSGACLRWAVVRAGHASANDREGMLEAMKPRASSPGWAHHNATPTHATEAR